MPVLRRVYGEADDATYFAFRDRARSEGLSMNEAMSAIVLAYARGYVLVRPKTPKEHHKPEGADYGREAQKGS